MTKRPSPSHVYRQTTHTRQQPIYEAWCPVCQEVIPESKVGNGYHTVKVSGKSMVHQIVRRRRSRS